MEVNLTLVPFCVVRRSDEEIRLTSAVVRLIHTYRAVLMPCCAVALRSRFPNGMDGARQECGVGTAWARPQCVNQMGKINLNT